MNLHWTGWLLVVGAFALLLLSDRLGLLLIVVPVAIIISCVVSRFARAGQNRI